MTDLLDDAINYYYEAQVSGLHNCDLGATTWSEQLKYIGDGNDWSHIYCVKTRQIIKKTDYTNKREEYDILKNLRELYRDDKKEYNKLNKKNYIIKYGVLKDEIIYRSDEDSKEQINFDKINNIYKSSLVVDLHYIKYIFVLVYDKNLLYNLYL